MSRSSVFVSILTVLITLGTFVFYFPFDYLPEPELKEGYVIPFSTSIQEEPELFLHCNKNLKSAKFEIFNCEGLKINNFTSAATSQENNEEQPWANGAGYESGGRLPELESGLYFIENQVPFLKKDSVFETGVTLVIPFITKVCNSRFGGKSFYSSDPKNPAAKVLNVRRPISIGMEDRKFINLVMRWAEDHEVPINIVEEKDLINQQLLNSTKLLVLFSKPVYWTLETRMIVHDFLLEGGNMLMATSYAMDNRVENINENQYQFEPVDSLSETGSWMKANIYFPNYKTIGGSYFLARPLDSNCQTFTGFKIDQPDHPIFAHISDSIKEIEIHDDFISGPPVIGFNPQGVPIVDTALLSTEHVHFLAHGFRKKGAYYNVGGIVEFRLNTNKGRAIHLGSDFSSNPKFESQSIYNQILRNALNFLSHP